LWDNSRIVERKSFKNSDKVLTEFSGRYAQSGQAFL
jgi:hypothetical protein